MPKLLNADFTKQVNTVNVLSPIATFTVPRGRVLRIRAGQTFVAYLGAKFTKTLGAGSSRTSDTVTLPTYIAQNPLWPDTGTVPDLRRARATWLGSAANITDRNYATPSVTVTVNDSAGDIVVYWSFIPGYLEIVGEAPGSQLIRKQFFNGDISVLQVTNQYQDQSAPRFTNEIILAQDMKLRVMLNAPAVVDWTYDQFQLEIPYEFASYDMFVTELMRQTKGQVKDLTNAIINSWIE